MWALKGFFKLWEKGLRAMSGRIPATEARAARSAAKAEKTITDLFGAGKKYPTYLPEDMKKTLANRQYVQSQNDILEVIKTQYPEYQKILAQHPNSTETQRLDLLRDKYSRLMKRGEKTEPSQFSFKEGTTGKRTRTELKTLMTSEVTTPAVEESAKAVQKRIEEATHPTKGKPLNGRQYIELHKDINSLVAKAWDPNNPNSSRLKGLQQLNKDLKDFIVDRYPQLGKELTALDKQWFEYNRGSEATKPSYTAGST